MTPWPFALTTAAVVHGAVYLLGATAPIDKVYLDGRRVPDVISTVALYGEANGSDFPEQAVSVVVPLPDWVRAGTHRLRLVRGRDSWRSALVVTAAPTVHAVEVGAACLRMSHGEGDLVYIRLAAGGRYLAPLGVIVIDPAGMRLGPVPQPIHDWSPPAADYWTPSVVAAGTVIQRIYADGSLGERWEFVHEDGYSACHTFQQPLPGGPGIPLWKDAAAGPP